MINLSQVSSLAGTHSSNNVLRGVLSSSLAFPVATSASHKDRGSLFGSPGPPGLLTVNAMCFESRLQDT